MSLQRSLSLSCSKKGPRGPKKDYFSANWAQTCVESLKRALNRVWGSKIDWDTVIFRHRVFVRYIFWYPIPLSSSVDVDFVVINFIKTLWPMKHTQTRKKPRIMSTMSWYVDNGIYATAFGCGHKKYSPLFSLVHCFVLTKNHNHNWLYACQSECKRGEEPASAVPGTPRSNADSTVVTEVEKVTSPVRESLDWTDVRGVRKHPIRPPVEQNCRTDVTRAATDGCVCVCVCF